MPELNPNLNEIKNIRSQMKVVVFQWAVEELTKDISDDELLSLATPLEVSSRVSSISFTKTLDEPAGSFSFTLENDRDWKEVLRPGQWCLIYMSNEAGLDPNPAVEPAQARDLQRISNKLRCVGYIDRVSVDYAQLDNGSADVTYTVTGRDFGVVYADTTIWHNFFESEQSVLEASNAYLNVNQIDTIDQLMIVLHHLIFAPLTLNFKPNQKFTSLGIQWLMPKSLFQALNLRANGSRPSFYGNISHLLDEISPTAAGRPTESPLTFLNGNAWDILRSISIQPFHELFTELNNDGEPRLVFRPIPWKLNDQGYTVLRDNILSLRDLSNSPDTNVPLEAVDILTFSIGEDNHSRYNHFFTYLATALYSTFSNASVLLNATSSGGRQFPFGNRGSIKRHGFRPMHAEVNSLTEINEKSDAKPNERLLVQYNELMFDYYNSAVFFENGTVEIIGKNEVKLGKTLTFAEDTPYNGDKIFYIEGYEDRYTVNPNGDDEWIQTLQVTRGVNKKVLDGRAEPFERIRQFLQTGDFTEID